MQSYAETSIGLGVMCGPALGSGFFKVMPAFDCCNKTWGLNDIFECIQDCKWEPVMKCQLVAFKCG